MGSSPSPSLSSPPPLSPSRPSSPRSRPTTPGPPPDVFRQALYPPRLQLPDPDKPPIPYVLGAQFTVRRHVPPPPFGRPYPTPHPEPPENLQKLTQLEHCLANPPRKGSMCDEVFTFVITKELVVKDGRGAQLVIANDTLVAKIYDPLYYPPIDDYTGLRTNVVHDADFHYSREAAAYDELSTIFRGEVIPEYHGSWTCDVLTKTSSGPTVTRPVRLILVELINGICMQHLNPNQLIQDQRSNIMVKAIEARLEISFHGVRQRDFAPRNVIVQGDLMGDDFRVVIIDFNLSVVQRLAGEPRMKDLYSKPISPIKWHWGYMNDFVATGWVPSDYQNWLITHFSGLDKFTPVFWEDGSPRLSPIQSPTNRREEGEGVLNALSALG
jgi:hypothetical protein